MTPLKNGRELRALSRPLRRMRPPAPATRQLKHRANVTAVLGSTGTGKGLYSRERLMRPHPGRVFVWSPLEGKLDHYGELLKVRPVCSIPALIAAVRAGALRHVYVPRRERDGTFAGQFDLFCRLVLLSPGARVHVEELHKVTSAQFAPYAWQDVTTAGRHDRIELIATAQFPAQIDKAFLSSCTEIRCYRLLDENHAKVVARILRVAYGELQQLADLHFFHWSVADRVTVSGVQSIV